ncbi:hypothetical protein AKJ09_00460 [Labilithrix luteola]|uniref:Type IV fimbrial biogenesis protein PilY1 n=1 Tax=Labilithrix luteola TaxID=1391654 RepID=A0A0K1PK79_9BACT|nr:hypothetical protein AKJ09_00460 [Labilithrix luteola]
MLLAIASTNFWTGCSSSDSSGTGDSLDGGTDAGPTDASSAEVDAEGGVPTCNASFCRTSLPDLSGVAINASWAVSESDVWVGGSGGFVAHFDGTSWTRVKSGTRASIFGITAGADGTVWGANGGYTLLKLNRAANGAPENVRLGNNAIFDGISASGSELFMAGALIPEAGDTVHANMWRFGAHPDGGVPSVVPISPPCPGRNDPGERCTKLHGVWAESAQRQWFVGEAGKVYLTDSSPRPDGEPIRFIEMNSSSLRTLKAIWGFGSNDVWAVGIQGVIRHWTGGDPKVDAWHVVPSPVTRDLLALWGSRPDDIWAVGDQGVVIHWDGSSWTEREIPYAEDRRPRFYTVTAAGDDVWIGGVNAFLRSNRATGTK